MKFIDDLRERIVAELTEVFDKRVSAVELLVRDVRTNSREHAGHIRRLENRLADLKATNGNHHDKLLDAMKALSVSEKDVFQSKEAGVADEPQKMASWEEDVEWLN